MEKRGPTIDFKWMRRWCVLTASTLEVYVDEERRQLKATHAIKHATRAASFRHVGSANPGAPGESVKHWKTKPHGFALDLDPNQGKDRLLYYFDALSQDDKQAWLDAIAAASAQQPDAHQSEATQGAGGDGESAEQSAELAAAAESRTDNGNQKRLADDIASKVISDIVKSRLSLAEVGQCANGWIAPGLVVDFADTESKDHWVRATVVSCTAAGEVQVTLESGLHVEVTSDRVRRLDSDTGGDGEGKGDGGKVSKGIEEVDDDDDDEDVPSITRLTSASSESKRCSTLTREIDAEQPDPDAAPEVIDKKGFSLLIGGDAETVVVGRKSLKGTELPVLPPQPEEQIF